ncbi:MAG: hypothetical protein NTW03_07440 [Verrucomicrobia bacterium]|nr:hypothetical protein [Verrucomicrobiota bacterium]
MKYLRRPLPRERVTPEDVRPEEVMTDYEFAFARRPVNCDDWIPFAAPWRAIPWLEAWCGCPVRFASGSLGPDPVCDSIEALAAAPLPAHDEWFSCLRRQTELLAAPPRQTELLAAQAPPDCWISPTILRGPSDVLAALRGLTNFLCDLRDAPEVIMQAAGRIQQLLIRALDQHLSLVKPKHGGYGHIFGYWAPTPTIALQEDVLGLCHPNLYRDLFMNYTAEAVRHLGGCVVFHMHSTGFQHFRHALRIPGLAGLQMTIEANGPPLADLVPVFREILEQSRLLLFLDHRFEELPGVLPHLPREGLYLAIPETCLPSETAFLRFTKAHWPEDA